MENQREWTEAMRRRGLRVQVEVRTPVGLALESVRRLVTHPEDLARALGLPVGLVELRVRGGRNSPARRRVSGEARPAVAGSWWLGGASGPHDGQRRGRADALG